MHKQSKSRPSNHKGTIARGQPPSTATQREKILELLRKSEPCGFSRAELIFSDQMTQCATRVFELRKIGFVICSEDRGGDYPTWYVLESEPLDRRPLPASQPEKSSGDLYDKQTGKLRPSDEISDLPLFAAVRR